MFGYICLPNICLSEAYLWICLEMFIVASVKKSWRILLEYIHTSLSLQQKKTCLDIAQLEIWARAQDLYNNLIAWITYSTVVTLVMCCPVLRWRINIAAFICKYKKACPLVKTWPWATGHGIACPRVWESAEPFFFNMTTSLWIITCSPTKFSLIEQGLYFAAPWKRNLLIHSMTLFLERHSIVYII